VKKLLVFLVAITALAQTHTPVPSQLVGNATVGHAFTMAIPALAGGTGCTVRPRGPQTPASPAAPVIPFSFSGGTLSGTPTKAGVLRVVVNCTVNGAAVPQRVLVKVAAQ
jgi:hypothetical protein